MVIFMSTWFLLEFSICFSIQPPFLCPTWPPGTWPLLPRKRGCWAWIAPQNWTWCRPQSGYSPWHRQVNHGIVIEYGYAQTPRVAHTLDLGRSTKVSEKNHGSHRISGLGFVLMMIMIIIIIIIMMKMLDDVWMLLMLMLMMMMMWNEAAQVPMLCVLI